MLAPRLFRISWDAPGRLFTMAAPRGGDWLPDEMVGLSRLGVNVLVSLLTTQENWELRLEAEPQAAADAGLQFMALPTPDRGTPAAGLTRTVAQRLLDDVLAGRNVAIHCRAGIGRASLLAAAVLTLDAVPTADAWQRITDARGLPVPDTDEQRKFIANFAAQVHPPSQLDAHETNTRLLRHSQTDHPVASRNAR